jgi:hypothetical protein
MSIIYHYTTVDALLGMLKECSSCNKKLKMWATHSMFMNDPTEYEYGKEICQDLLRDIEEELGIDGTDRLSHSMYTDSMKEYFNSCEMGSSNIPTAIYNGKPYVISLSKLRDDLKMWIPYSNNGRGVAIGFNKEKLNKYLEDLRNQEDASYDFTIRDCIYKFDEENFINIKNSLKMYYDIIQQAENISREGDEITESDMHAARLEYILLLNSQVASFVKIRDYEYEQEVRCKINKAKDIKFRESNGLLIPYVELEIPVEVIDNIIIGPTLDAERMKLSLEMLLNAKSVKRGIDIVASKVLYRAK